MCIRDSYSLTGATGTWVHIPEFDTDTALGAGARHAQITLPSAWEVGANFYILWTDDDGQPASTSATASTVEGPYTIDNFALTFQVTPVSIAVQPHDITLETCRTSNLVVTATGTGPITYQWFHDGIPVGASSPTFS